MPKPVSATTPELCCATCTYWTLRYRRPWCPILKERLEGDLQTQTCDSWQLERVETHARELYERLTRVS
ncbi:MAG: hypothetical protein EI684_06020 [Candidatus Viridilinea halotolerans]|uniref:Uncharacterized protein n=1 Tax=Candidatus Viridilinea halotolerans TaxID=2491704 RepID=A0A426U4Q7_9CHLR|nr:MAG: hypothetical protein EI684_06020 [Candidatus Viridilinea halotolerans]